MDDGDGFSLIGKNVVTEANLRDEYYWKLIADFIGPQSGEGLELDQGPCKNRVLIQVGLLKDEHSFPWVAIIDWLQKIFPLYRTSDFRRLIERGTATTLSLFGDSRQTFLELAVNFNFVGSICDSVGIERRDLLELRDFSERAQLIEITNGLVLELDDFIQRENLAPVVIVHWLQNFDSEFCKMAEYGKVYSGLKGQIKRLRIFCSNSETKSQRRNVAIETLLHSPFYLELEEPLPDNPKTIVKKRGKKEEALNTVTIEEDLDTCEMTPDDAPVLKKSKKSEKNEESHKVQETSNNAEETGDYDKSQTLIDIAVVSVHKLSNVFSGITEECQEVCLKLLKNQYAMTCKEHPTISEFERTLTLSSKDFSIVPPVEFIHHNANFIAELHQLVEQEIMCIEKEVIRSTGSNLGRDKLPKFHSLVNFTESTTSRYIHMACGLLSPQSSDNRNYRKYWMAFCQEKRNPSEVMEKPTNRINNYYEAAAGLIHHYKEIGAFFSDLLLLENEKYPNITLESVIADANDTIIQSLVCVVALVYCKILGPYWQLFKSSAAYSLYPNFLLSLYQKFLDWVKDPATMLELERGMNIFSQFPISERHYSGVFGYCGHWHTKREFIRACLKRVVKAIAASADKHLMDFLPGGRYSQVPLPDLSRKLSNCTFSTLFTENPFGQMCPPNQRNPNNNSSSSGSEDEEDNLSGCVEEAGNPNDSVEEVETEMDTKPPPPKKHPEIEIMDRDYIIEMVKGNGGPCRTKQDVDKLMLRFERKNRAERKEGVRCEILYQRMILNNNSRYLTGDTCTNLVAKLKASLPTVKPGFSLVLAPKNMPHTQRLKK